MSRFSSRGGHTAAFVLGLAVAAFSYWMDGWWLDSGRGALRTTSGLIVIGALVALGRGDSPWAAGRALWLGALIGMAIVLFRVGPGTIWPIVLVVVAAVAAAAVFTGVVAALALNRLRH
jgi:hypothetical protein